MRSGIYFLRLQDDNSFSRPDGHKSLFCIACSPSYRNYPSIAYGAYPPGWFPRSATGFPPHSRLGIVRLRPSLPSEYGHRGGKSFQCAIRSIERTIELFYLRRFGLLTIDIYYNETIGNTIYLLPVGIYYAQKNTVFFLLGFKKSIHQKLRSLRLVHVW